MARHNENPHINPMKEKEDRAGCYVLGGTPTQTSLSCSSLHAICHTLIHPKVGKIVCFHLCLLMLPPSLPLPPSPSLPLHHPSPTTMTWTKLNFPPHRHKYKHTYPWHPHFQPFSILLHLAGLLPQKATHSAVPPPYCHAPQQPRCLHRPAGLQQFGIHVEHATHHKNTLDPSDNHFSTLIFFINFALAANNLRPCPPSYLPPQKALNSRKPSLTSSSCSSTMPFWPCHSTIFALSSSLILFAAKFCRFIGKLLPQSVVPPEKKETPT